jgi:hypothetical protein
MKIVFSAENIEQELEYKTSITKFSGVMTLNWMGD